jgi:dynein light chain 1
MDNLRILSLGRNLLKKIENVEVVAETLEELWLSYNQIEKLVSAAFRRAAVQSN